MDLAMALDIDEKDIAFSGQLSLAFGAKEHKWHFRTLSICEKLLTSQKCMGQDVQPMNGVMLLDHQLAIFYELKILILLLQAKNGTNCQIYCAICLKA